MTDRVSLAHLEELAADDVLDLVETDDFLALLAAVRALPGLMEIAEIAMPDTYFASDSRVVAARAVLAKFDLDGGGG